jgi:quinol monooxygenase YgiN
MFTRVVEVRAKKDKVTQFTNTLNEKIMPILREQQGFVDIITLVSTSEPERMVSISFWKSEADAQRYNEQHYPRIREMITDLTESSPRVQTYTVDTSTTHRIAQGKAA